MVSRREEIRTPVHGIVLTRIKHRLATRILKVNNYQKLEKCVGEKERYIHGLPSEPLKVPGIDPNDQSCFYIRISLQISASYSIK